MDVFSYLLDTPKIKLATGQPRGVAREDVEREGPVVLRVNLASNFLLASKAIWLWVKTNGTILG